ncbi:MAG: hypothetical protein IJN50_04385 [Clostridia bacterium]|nr:hypothetical protein [Clostridia bacterium]
MEKSSFLKILKDYFSNIDDGKILMGDRDGIVIPMEWIFTEKVDRAIIERAMVNILKENNPNYIRGYIKDEVKKYSREHQGEGILPISEKRREASNRVKTKIKSLSIKMYKGTFEICLEGLDGWTKAVISEKPYDKSKILQIGEDEFFKKILDVMKRDNAESIVNSLSLSDEAREKLQTIFLSQQSESLDNLTLDGIEHGMSVAAKNLTEYYDYMYEEKQESSIRSITIKQRQGSRSENKNYGGVSVDRKSPIYPFRQREKVLSDMKPESIINVDEIDENDNVIPGFYTAFVYKNPRDKGGYLLIAEPLEGSHSTRVVYLSDEKYDAFAAKEGHDKMESIAQYYLEMSNEEFSKEMFAQKINHKEMQNFQDKLRYIVRGEESETIKAKKPYYKKLIDRIFEGKRFSPSDLGEMGADAPLGEVGRISNDFSEQIIDKTKKAKGE